MNTKKTAVVIGAGIVGLASARALAIEGYDVTVYERHLQAAGASIRNFGMIWPVGQPAGEGYEWAVRSRDIWKDICKQAAIWHEQTGSLHLAYNEIELAVMEEYVANFGHERDCTMLTSGQTARKSAAANPAGLLGALWSGEEVIVDPRQAIAKIPLYLEERWGVRFNWNTAVNRIVDSTVYLGNGGSHKADLVVVCSGADFETLYPELFKDASITKCKLQMMRLVSQPNGWRIGPPLCGGLSMLHYGAFQSSPSVAALRHWAEKEMPEYLMRGIHVMVSQHGHGELTIGDSHEYGISLDPFDRRDVEGMILDYLRKFTQFKDYTLLESWHGVYAKMTSGENHLALQPEENVVVVNALGGAGMTLSFGLAEHIIQRYA